MRPRPAALAARLAAVGGRLAVPAVTGLRRRGRRRDRHRLSLEHYPGLRLVCGRPGLEGIVHLLDQAGVLAALVLGLALLDDREERRRDEDRRVRTGGDADEDREREVLERLAAEDEEREDREQRDDRRRDRAADRLPEGLVGDRGEARAPHDLRVLAHAVEDDDGVVDRVTQDGEQRRD